jgi:hypothetical protein
MKNVFLKFGNTGSYELVLVLFYIGIIPIAYKCIQFGKWVYLNNTYQITVKQGDWFTGKEVNHLPLGIFQGVILFIVSIIIWKIICEMLLIVLKYFERRNG